MNQFSIKDLHCDLLCYLAGGVHRTAFDQVVRCSIPQLEAGNVKLQVLPIFTETCLGSSLKGQSQAEIFYGLPKNYPEAFDSKIDTLLAIENASSFCEEQEPLELGLQRLDAFHQKAGKIVYISLTWNSENRFGGGAHTSVGLKSDGKKLLDFMHRKNIAVDLSHTSDSLANDLLNYIDQMKLEIPVLASHSNFRSITNVPRNLPDELAKEIMRRDGLIGINFVCDFIGAKNPDYFVNHLEHAIKLGGFNHICFGADFFYSEDISPEFRKKPEEYFFPEYGDSTVYKKILNLWQLRLGLDDEFLEKIAHKNLEKYLRHRFSAAFER